MKMRSCHCNTLLVEVSDLSSKFLIWASSVSVQHSLYAALDARGRCQPVTDGHHGPLLLYYRSASVVVDDTEVYLARRSV